MKALRFGLVGFISFLAITLGPWTFADSAIIRAKTGGNDINLFFILATSFVA